MNILTKALHFAKLKHSGQKRRSGEDYINHPMCVAQLVSKYKMSHKIDVLLASAYLHDVLEDTDTRFNELINEFGVEIANIVKELTTNDSIKNAIGKDKYLAYKLNDMSSWALAIKLCDRLHNISDINLQTDDFKVRYSKETIFIIDYIMNNRNLSLTHLKIIKDISNLLKNCNLSL